ncbi:MAG: ABC transporter permease [Pseudomonadota bacterium]|jgi:ABC-type Na+ efflux pump permease subunit
MIRNILLVALREFRQITGMRSFWLTLLILPIVFAGGPIASKVLGSDDTQRVMLIDADGREATAIRNRLDGDRQRRILTALSRYAQRYALDRANPTAVWAQHDRLYGEADVAAFVKAGGLPAALAAMKRLATPETPAFDPPEADFTIVPTPPSIATADPVTLDRLLKPLVQPGEFGDKKARPLDYAVYIPRGFGTRATVARLWSSEQPGADFVQPLQSVLTQRLRIAYLQSTGLAPEQAAAATTLVPSIAISTPAPGGGRERMLVRSIVPLLSAYILLMSLLLSGNWVLQGLVEERSNKLIETVLACVSPDELLYGKLAGTVAVGLTMVAVWGLCATGAAFATQGAVGEFLRMALAPLASPWIILVMLYFFLAGYLMVSMILLAIGAMSDSMRDAQSYLTPVLMVIAMPFTIVAQGILSNTGATALKVLTWIPLYTPFTMLARLGSGVSVWEIVGSALTLAAFIAIEFVLLARVFRASLLNAGQKPNLAALARLMRRDSA